MKFHSGRINLGDIFTPAVITHRRCFLVGPTNASSTQMYLQTVLTPRDGQLALYNRNTSC
jgi:hypothetical protein